MLLLVSLGKQLLDHELSRRARGKNIPGSAEGYILLIATLIVAARCALKMIRSVEALAIPELESGWIVFLTLACVIYLGAKARRHLQMRET